MNLLRLPCIIMAFFGDSLRILITFFYASMVFWWTRMPYFLLTLKQLLLMHFCHVFLLLSMFISCVNAQPIIFWSWPYLGMHFHYDFLVEVHEKFAILSGYSCLISPLSLVHHLFVKIPLWCLQKSIFKENPKLSPY